MSKELNLYTIRATDKNSGKANVHKNITFDELEEIKLTSTLFVEILEINKK